MDILMKKIIVSVMHLAAQSLKTPSRAGYYQPKSNELKISLRKRTMMLFVLMLIALIPFTTLRVSCEELEDELESLTYTVNETVGTIVVQDYNIGGDLISPL